MAKFTEKEIAALWTLHGDPQAEWLELDTFMAVHETFIEMMEFAGTDEKGAPLMPEGYEIKLNNASFHEICPVCDCDFKAAWGPVFFVKDTWNAVCDDCGWRLLNPAGADARAAAEILKWESWRAAQLAANPIDESIPF